MSSIFAIDPGYKRSAWVQLIDGHPVAFAHEDNAEVLDRIKNTTVERIAVEMVAGYGMAVGAEVFGTCVWAGRFIQAWLDGPNMRLSGWRMRDEASVLRVYRKDVKLHLCGLSRAKDANVRRALIDRYGPEKSVAVGLKASPGPLYGVSGDVWAALAVAVTAADELAGTLPLASTPDAA